MHSQNVSAAVASGIIMHYHVESYLKFHTTLWCAGPIEEHVQYLQEDDPQEGSGAAGV